MIHVAEQRILELGVTAETEFFTRRTMVGSLTRRVRPDVPSVPDRAWVLIKQGANDFAF